MLDSFLDRSVLGYTSLGFALRPHPPVDVDLRGRNVIVTGATSGLGQAAALRLAELGARVCIVGRSEDKLARTADQLKQRAPASEVTTERADLSLMSDVRALAARIQGPVHILINNAGVLIPTRTETAEGLETTFATNLLGHFLLTRLLIENLAAEATASQPSRVINVSSGGMYTQRVRVDDLEMKRGKYDGAVAYARTKRAQVILTKRWAEELSSRHIVVHAMHPGWADTPGVSTSLPRFYRVTKPLLRSPEQGADTIVWLAAAAEPAQCTGLFWHDRRPRPIHRMRSTKETQTDREALHSSLLRYGDG